MVEYICCREANISVGFKPTDHSLWTDHDLRWICFLRSSGVLAGLVFGPKRSVAAYESMMSGVGPEARQRGGYAQSQTAIRLFPVFAEEQGCSPLRSSRCPCRLQVDLPAYGSRPKPGLYPCSLGPLSLSNQIVVFPEVLDCNVCSCI